MRQSDWHPGTLLELSGSYWQTCTLHAGVKLDLFTHLDDSPSTAEDLARRAGADPRALAMLLNALCAMALLTKQGHVYHATDAGRRFLSKNSDAYIGQMILHHHHLVPSWAALDTAVKTGDPVRAKVTASSAERREAFLMGMFNLASMQAPEIVKHVDLSSRRRLLDLGGGPGTYAIYFCMANPQLSAVVFDLPTTAPFAKKTISRFGLDERIAFHPGSFTEDDLPGGFDAVWMSHILHGEGPRACQQMVDKAASALEPGGLMMIHDFYLDDSMDGPLFPALFSLNMLLGTQQGQAYSEGQVRAMMEKAGITRIQRNAYVGPTQSGMLTGIKG